MADKENFIPDQPKSTEPVVSHIDAAGKKPQVKRSRSLMRAVMAAAAMIVAGQSVYSAEALAGPVTSEQQARFDNDVKTGRISGEALEQFLAAQEKTNPLSAKEKSKILETLETRLSKPANNFKRPKGVNFSKVKKALEANPAAIYSLYKMEETGGAPDVISVESNAFVFADTSKESPEGRRNLTYAEAAKMADEMGVEIMDEATYTEMAESGKFDIESWGLIKTSPDMLAESLALGGHRNGAAVFVSGDNADDRSLERGWRGMLRVEF